MQLTDVEGYVLRDLFDPTNLRWATADVDRAIDRAVDRYTTVFPNVVYTDMQMQPYQRTYPYPQSWNANYPVLWIEKILYPLQVYGSQFPAPTTAPSAARSSGSGMGTGVYQYLVTFLTQGGETPAGPAVSVTTTGGNNQVQLTNIPVSSSNTIQPGIATNNVIGRAIYRTAVGGSTFFYLTAIQDNVTTTYLDTAADASINTNPSPPIVNTSGVMVWPVFERNFAEYSNIYDTSNALAAGGNMAMMGAVGDNPLGPTGTGAPSFTLILSPAELPKDNNLCMRVFYATKHRLDNSGVSTIPEIHRDVIVLGSCAYAIEAYSIPTNDGFVFQDGGLRDHMDDTHIPDSWQAWAKVKKAEFEGRIAEIKQNRDFASSSRAQWGDIPVRWSRL